MEVFSPGRFFLSKIGYNLYRTMMGLSRRGNMEISDYSQRLGQARDNYWDTAKKLKDNYEHDLNSLEETHQYKTNKQAGSYNKDRLELQSDNERKSQFYADKTKQEIQSKQSEYRDRLKETETDFSKQNQALRQQFRDRLNQIGSSFDKSLNQRELQQSEELSQVRDYTDKKLSQNTQSFQKELKDIKNASDSRADDMQDHQRRMLKEKDSAYSDRLLDINRNNSKKLSDVKNKGNEELERSQLNHENELSQLVDHKNTSMTQLRDNHQRSQEALTDSFARVGESMEKRFVEDNKRLAKEGVDQNRDMETKFQKEISAIRSIASQNDEANNLRMNQSSLEKQRVSDDYESRLNRLKEDMEDGRGKQEKVMSLANDDFTNTLKSQKRSAAQAYDAAQRQNDLDKATQLTESRKKRDETESRYATALNTQDRQFSDKLQLQDKTYRNIADANQRRHEQMLGMAEKNKEIELKSLTQSVQDEKTQFIEKTRKDVHNEKVEMKEDMMRNFSIKSDNLEQQLAQKDADHKQTVADYEAKLTEFKKKVGKEFERYQALEEDRRIEEGRAVKQTLLAKDYENNRVMIDVKRRYDKELSQVKMEHDLQTKKMIEVYEEQLGQLRNESSKELQVKLGMMKDEYENLKKNSELRLEALKTQYELKIDKMRMASQEAEVTRGNRGRMA